MQWKKLSKTMQSMLAITCLSVVFGAGALIGASNLQKPKSVVHVITFMWADGVTPAQKQQVYAATEKMARETPGLTRLWTKGLKVQGPKPEYANNIIAMEFESAEAFAKYAGSPSHKEWYKAWLPARGESRTHDVSND